MESKQKNTPFNHQLIKFFFIGLLAFLLIGCEQTTPTSNDNSIVNSENTNTSVENGNTNSSTDSTNDANKSDNSTEANKGVSSTDANKICSKDDTSLKKVSLKAVNKTDKTLVVYWVNFDCKEEKADPPTVKPGETFEGITYETDVFRFKDAETNEIVKTLIVDPAKLNVEITAK